MRSAHWLSLIVKGTSYQIFEKSIEIERIKLFNELFQSKQVEDGQYVLILTPHAGQFVQHEPWAAESKSRWR